ncbi:cysteine-rich CWC family protein [Paenibacillus hamazuiensis]|uniref:cysteine-rich CWC family protein n=1 Tax=Paenibacillus hamazuiensis TaxID=2936508 RepID=UPI00200F4825|nr:cysteine-rich CWC family protein [Paenibacillus hamazuiensis]
MTDDNARLCPFCNEDNRCGRMADEPDGACWCSKEVFPQRIFESLPPDRLGTSCICKSCLDKFKNGRSAR